MPKGFGAGSKVTQFKPLTKSLWERFEDAHTVDVETGCWPWIAQVDSKGYGRLTVNGKSRLASRISYELHVGTPKHFVLHHCDNPLCVNPHHLYDGTQKDNMRDRSARGRMPDQRGELSHRAKLTNEEVLAIRADCRSQRIIADIYGVCQSTISLIKLRKRRSHI